MPQDWLAELDRFVQVLARHPWGGEGAERLIVSDDLASALAEWMHADEWAADKPAVDAYAGTELQPGGKAFLAKDGRWSVAVAASSEKELFLMTAGHELIEAALEQRQRDAGEIWQGQSVLGLSHLVWSEYVVERTRTEIGRELGFEPASQETNRALLRTAAHTQRLALSAGAVSPQSWVDLMLMWARVLGRVDGGHELEARDVQAFYAHGMMSSVAPGWQSLHESLREVFESPGTPSPAIDQAVALQVLPVLNNRPRPPS